MISEITPPPVPVKRASPYDLRAARWAGLASTIRAKQITVQALYRLSPLVVGQAIVGYREQEIKGRQRDLPRIGQEAVPPNLSEAAVILSRAAKGSFPYFFNARGERLAEGRDDQGHTLPGVKIVECLHYNLPFFFGLSLSMNGIDWINLVNAIKTLNSPLGETLNDIGRVMGAVERMLVLEHNLKPKEIVGPSESSVSSRSASPSKPITSPIPPGPPRRPVPPPIPGKQDHDPDKTVRNRR
jgi:hypothetical protein